MNFLAEARRCTGCGACQPVCPVYKIVPRETAGPRGRLALIKAFLEKRLASTDIASSLDSCLLCGQCDHVCPASIPLKDIFALSRKNLPSGHASLAECSFLFMGNHPLATSRILGAGAKLASLLPVKQFLPPVAIQALNRPAFPHYTEKAHKRVLLFAGCTAAYFLPNIVTSCVKLLASQGFQPILPADLSCCGRPALLSGRETLAARQCKKNIDLILRQQVDILVTPCPGCLDSITNLWQYLASVEQIARFKSVKVMDINALIARNFPEWETGSRTVWHKPCLMNDENANAAKKLAGIVKQENTGGCCGMPLQFVQKELSGKLARDFGQDIRAAKPKLVVTACPGCIIKLYTSVRGILPHLKIRHSVEICSETYIQNVSNPGSPHKH